MNILKITPEYLKAEAIKIEAQGEKVASILDEMIAVIDSVGVSVWSGDAALAYKTRVDGLTADASDMRAVSGDMSEALTTIAGQYMEAEQANAQAAHSLATDIF